jgi:hypothetical protein
MGRGFVVHFPLEEVAKINTRDRDRDRGPLDLFQSL